LGTSLALAVLSGGLVLLVNERHRVKIALTGCAVFLAVNMMYCRVDRYEDITITGTAASFLKASTPMDSMEYLPKWVKRVSIAAPPQKLQAISGQSDVVDQGGGPLDRRFKVRADTPALMVFHSYYFPGWEVFIDGQLATLQYDNPFGLIMFSMPPGDHMVRVHFGLTPLRQFFGLVSLFVLISLFVLFIYRNKFEFLMKS
jgi:hypothetical protein